MLCISRRSCTCDFRVLVHRGGAHFAMGAAGNFVAGDLEEIGNRIQNGYEALQMSSRFETLHYPLTLSDRLMGIPGTVIEAVAFTSRFQLKR